MGHDKYHVVLLSSFIVDTTANYLLQLSAKHLFLRKNRWKDRGTSKCFVTSTKSMVNSINLVVVSLIVKMKYNFSCRTVQLPVY